MLVSRGPGAEGGSESARAADVYARSRTTAHGFQKTRYCIVAARFLEFGFSNGFATFIAVVLHGDAPVNFAAAIA
jgi:hypothetical protein